MMPLTMIGVDSRVRLRSTGEMYVVEGIHWRNGAACLTLSKHGHLAGGVNLPSEYVEVKRDEVVLLKQVTEWVDDE